MNGLQRADRQRSTRRRLTRSRGSNLGASAGSAGVGMGYRGANTEHRGLTQHNKRGVKGRPSACLTIGVRRERSRTEREENLYIDTQRQGQMREMDVAARYVYWIMGYNKLQ